MDPEPQSLFEWERIGEVYLPAIFREGRKYVSARMVDIKLFSRYPTVPKELCDARVVISSFITQAESNLLNRINHEVCEAEYGIAEFTQNDVVVPIKEFKEFYQLVYDTLLSKNHVYFNQTTGGWLQLNNTVCPYVWHNSIRHVPYEIVRLAAELLTEDTDVPLVKISGEELDTLNSMCEDAKRTFTFDLDTTMISLVYMKLKTNPVIIELPPDAPFDEAHYIDPESDSSAIERLKDAGRQSMQSYYLRCQQNPIETGAAPYCEPPQYRFPQNVPPQNVPAGNGEHVIAKHPQMSTMLGHPVNHPSPSPQMHRPQYAQPQPPPPYPATPMHLSQQQAHENMQYGQYVKSMNNNNHMIAHSGSGHSVMQETLPPCINRQRTHPRPGESPSHVMSPAKSSPARPYAMPDPMDAFRAPEKTNYQRYLPDEIIFSWSKEVSLNSPQILALCKKEECLAGVVSGLQQPMTQCRLAGLHLIMTCNKISSKAIFLFGKATQLIEQDPSVAVNIKSECLSIMKDACSSFAFWNASSHLISAGAAERINGALVRVCLDDQPYSYRRSPDIVHHLIGGVFGARTMSGATNFRFLQELMGVSLIACGRAPVHPTTAYHQMLKRLVEFRATLTKWCTVVPTTVQPDITLEKFASDTYRMYVQVYGDEMPSHSVENMPRQVKDTYPVNTPMNIDGEIKTNPKRKHTSAEQHPIKKEKLLHCASEGCSQISSPPAAQHPPSKISTSAPKQPAHQPVHGVSQSADDDEDSDDLGLCITSVTSVTSMKPDAPVFEPAPPVKVSMQPSKICHVTPTQLGRESTADNVVLSRIKSKKIASYKKGTAAAWLLLEDVQRIYFPRKSLDDVLKLLKSLESTILTPLTPECAKAFRDFYDMAESEHFEVDLMISSQNLERALSVTQMMTDEVKQNGGPSLLMPVKDASG